MKKPKPVKLALSRETLKLLTDACLRDIVGGETVPTRQLPCPIATAKVDCG